MLIAVLSKLKAKVSNWWAYTNMSEDERFLSSAVDHADLKHRMLLLDERRRMQARVFYYNLIGR